MRYPIVVAGLLHRPVAGLRRPVVAAGVGAGALMTATDRRSSGAIVEDDTIESKAQKRISEKYKDTVHVNVTTYNRFALVTGTAATEEAQDGYRTHRRQHPQRQGHRQRTGRRPTSPPAVRSSSDARITGNVKMRFVKSPALKADQVKVVTENGVVYLMGLVTRAEADAASDIASTTRGVQKVVRVFEYID